MRKVKVSGVWRTGTPRRRRRNGSDEPPRVQAINQTLVSWYCDQCSVEVYQLRCVHCGKTKREEK